LHFFAFWLDSCIVNKGEKFGLELAFCTLLEGGIGLTGEGHQSDRCSSMVLGDLVN
jgi:hypothetical protein